MSGAASNALCHVDGRAGSRTSPRVELRDLDAHVACASGDNQREELIERRLAHLRMNARVCGAVRRGAPCSVGGAQVRTARHTWNVVSSASSCLKIQPLIAGARADVIPTSSSVGRLPSSRFVASTALSVRASPSPTFMATSCSMSRACRSAVSALCPSKRARFGALPFCSGTDMRAAPEVAALP